MEPSLNADLQLLAVLVHRALLDQESAHAAMQSGDPAHWLQANGKCTAKQWALWQQTIGGTRPVLSRYDVKELLGEGGSARVFAALDRTDGRRVALKVLRTELSQQPAQVEAFVREAKLLLDLVHPHLVRGYRVAREGETYFFAMEEVPGKSLQDELAVHQRFEELQALQIVLQVASALDVLHVRGLVHRDIKPGNILFSAARGAVLIDLGFAVPRGQPLGGETTAGTVHYIAPEQARGSSELDVRADIYALGATLYQLVTGSLPFEGQSNEDVLRKQVLESLSGERIRALQLSPQVHYFIEKMMAKEREIRFQDPKQLCAEIGAYLAAQESQRQLTERAQQTRPKLGLRRPRKDR
ncbi:MAG: serine/threonine-protein kinase [Planctomycetota bacterium]|nr:serine/threonine-protein kinase [Planctomycetota bacterium]MSR37244.1 serine/threonine protein kinase [Planctomycetota bacterium]